MEIRNAMDLGQRMHERRTALKMSQRAVAAEIGVTRQWVSAMERGNAAAEIGLVLKAVRFLGLVLDVRGPGASVGGGADSPAVDLGALLDRVRRRSGDDDV